MSKKAVLPLRVVRFQRVIAEEITDPAERAALDRAHERHKRKSAGHNKTNRHEAALNSVKAMLPVRIAPLQRVVAEEITDPAERAAIDKLRKRLKRRSETQEKKA